MDLLKQRKWGWMVAMANIVWGVGVEPKYLTDRTQMCFYIIPLLGDSEGRIAGGQQTPVPKRRRNKRRR